MASGFGGQTSNTRIGADTTGAPSVTIGDSLAAARTSPGSLPFATQSPGTVSAGQSIIVTNTGLDPLSLTGLTFAGTDLQDYLVTSNGCLGQIRPGGDCTIRVAFAPQQQ